MEWKLHKNCNKSLNWIFPSMFCPFLSRGEKSNNFHVTIARNIFQSSWHSKMASNTSQKHYENKFLIGVIIWNDKKWFSSVVPRRQWSLKCWKSNFMVLYSSSTSEVKSSSSSMTAAKAARLLSVSCVSLLGSASTSSLLLTIALPILIFTWGYILKWWWWWFVVIMMMMMIMMMIMMMMMMMMMMMIAFSLTNKSELF